MLFERKIKATGGGIGGQLSKVFYIVFFFLEILMERKIKATTGEGIGRKFSNVL